MLVNVKPFRLIEIALLQQMVISNAAKGYTNQNVVQHVKRLQTYIWIDWHATNRSHDLRQHNMNLTENWNRKAKFTQRYLNQAYSYVHMCMERVIYENNPSHNWWQPAIWIRTGVKTTMTQILYVYYSDSQGKKCLNGEEEIHMAKRCFDFEMRVRSLRSTQSYKQVDTAI